MRASAEALEHIDIHFARLLERLEGGESPALFAAAALASQKTREGHTCLDLKSALPDAQALAPGAISEKAEWLETLRQSRMVGRPGDFRPLILDAQGRLYLHRFHQFQETVAAEISSRALEAASDADPAQLRPLVEGLFPPPPPGETDWQRVAAVTAVLRRAAVISGGPGTGKTTIVARILALLLGLSPGAPPLISLAAPTGKAAARLLESLENELSRLGLPDSLAAHLPQRASTLHRLLGAGRKPGRFLHDRKNPLQTDVLIVDEASMVDLALMARVAAALPPRARLILLGDKDQLSSVGPGSVLGDLCAGQGMAGFTPQGAQAMEQASGQIVSHQDGLPPLADSLAPLFKNYRFSGTSGIGTLARAVVEGDPERALEALTAQGEITFSELNNPGALPGLLADPVLQGFHAYLESADPEQALEDFARFRILCGVRRGPWGVEDVNRLTEQLLHSRGMLSPEGRPWYEKRPVLVNRNDHALELFNGDTGCIMDGQAFFPSPGLGLRRMAPAMIPECETAFAMTVHKSQGSEFESVLFILPNADSPALTRELVYTAVTRTRRRLHIVGSRAALAKAVMHPTVRPSGLRDVLWGPESAE